MKTTIPIRTYSEMNMRGHWAKRARRAKQHRETALLFVQHALANYHPPPWNPISQGWAEVMITRIAPRALDTDNLAASLKAIRDGVADALQVNDGSSQITWRYAQQRGKPREYAVIIDIQGKP